MCTRKVQETVKVGAVEFPPILLGTSPFFGLTGFGTERAKHYRERFLAKPDMMVDIITESLRCGAGGVQTIAPNAPLTRELGRPPLIEALRRVETRIDSRVECVATVFDEEGIELLSEFNNKVIMTDGAVTDLLRADELLSLHDACKRRGIEFGLATHSPLNVIPKVRENQELWKKTKLLACPINRRGYFMTGPVCRSRPEDRDRALEILRESEKPILAIKTLAAGRTRPEEGCSYANRWSTRQSE